jgi:hypothetical protein
MVFKLLGSHRSCWGLIAVAFVASVIGLQCGSERATNPDLPVYGIEPDSVDIEVSSTQQFEVKFETVPSEVTWYVDGVRGGSPGTGMITPDGLFIAPSEVPVGGFVTITAKAELDSSVEETAKAVIRSGYGTLSIDVNPDSMTVILGDSTSFSATASGCPLAEASWSVAAVSAESDPPGTIRSDGTYLAPVSIPGDITLMVTVESPDCPGKKGLAKAVVLQPETFVVQFETFSDSSGSWILRNVSCGGPDLAVNGLDQPNQGDVLRVVVSEMGCPDSDSPVESNFVIDRGDGLT